jgi:hypothetical protein
MKPFFRKRSSSVVALGSRRFDSQEGAAESPEKTKLFFPRRRSVNLPTTETAGQRLEGRLQQRSFEEFVVSQKTLGDQCLAASNPETCLVDAAFDNDAKAVQMLALTDLRSFKKHVKYALFYAIQQGSYDAIKYMFWYGATIDAKDPINHLTVWDFARRSPDPEAMTSFLKRMKTGPSASESIHSLFTGGGNKLPKDLDVQTNKRSPSIVRRGTGDSKRKLKNRATI